MAIVASACIYFLYANPGWPGFSIAWSGLVNSADQEIAIIAIAFGIAAYLAVLYAFWRRKRDRWIIFIFTLVSIFIAPTFALVAILGAAFGKIDQSKPLNSNKKLELMMWSVTDGVFVICLTLADLQLIPLWVAIAITIASLAVKWTAFSFELGQFECLVQGKLSRVQEERVPSGNSRLSRMA
jgi:ABC-type proline/glycine betaine transport system permease subunit